MGFTPLFLACAIGLVVLIAATLVLPAPWSWLIGGAYIAYDTWLLVHLLRRSLRAAQAGAATGPDMLGPAVTVLIAAHNERGSIMATLDALPADTPAIVLDDGSDDGMAEALIARYALVAESARDGAVIARSPASAVTVVRLSRAGKAAALNRGLALATTSVVMTIDADTVLAPGSVDAARRAFAADPALGAACGVLAPVCSPGPWATVFAAFQRREYARAFLWRAGWSADGTLVLVSGACAIYRRDLLLAAGGFDTTSLVEDYEVMYRLHRLEPPPAVRVLAGVRATTDAPGDPVRFLRQRSRWFAGFLATVWRHRAMVGDQRLGRLGTWHLRLKTIDMLLPLYGIAALAALIVIWLRHGHLDGFVLALIAAKAVVDAALHAWADAAYHRWLGERHGSALGSVLASLAEQVAFQPLRQIGAAIGWLTLAGRTSAWRPNRIAACGLAAAALSAADLAPGLRLKADGHLPEAEAEFRRIAAAEPGNLDALTQLATVVGWQGRHAEAETLWSVAVRLAPQDADARVGLARVRYWRSDLAGAAVELQTVLDAHPDHDDARLLLGDVRLAEGRRDEAVAAYRAVAVRSPGSTEVVQRLARVGLAAPAPVWRLDAGGGGETYSAVHGDGHRIGVSGSVGRADLGDLMLGVDRHWLDGGRETTWTIGAGTTIRGRLGIQAAYARTIDRIVAPEQSIAIDAQWRMDAWLEPVAGWRRSFYPGDRADLWRPGIAAYPLVRLPDWAESRIEIRYLLADGERTGSSDGIAVSAALAHASGWTMRAGWARSDEAQPPQPSTRVVAWSAGVGWMGPCWGLRVDLEREDRHGQWRRDGASLGATCRF